MGLDDILNEYEKNKDDEKQRKDDAKTRLEKENALKLDAFMKFAEEILMPLLQQYKATLQDRGYPAKIIRASEKTHTLSGQLIEKITFAFGTVKSASDFSKTITFESADAPNVLITLNDGMGYRPMKREATAFEVKNELEEFFKKAFK
ncbi:MAG: hypothetical protein ACLPN1_07575 [Dissulfurispiraceae bacterium]|jgi:hypothetical protein